MNLPNDIAEACAPLFEQLPIGLAMPNLIGSHPTYVDLIDQIASHPAISVNPALASALWLYGGDLNRSHTISQSIEDATGSFWHGIMHRREGDFSNSHHWMRRAAGHPLIAARPDLDPDRFIDQVAAANVVEKQELVQKQSEEWQALFEFCAYSGS